MPNDPSRTRLPPPPAPVRRGAALVARALGTPLDFRRGPGAAPAPNGAPPADAVLDGGDQGRPREAATEAIGRRAGALSDELDFPEFVASLVHGTFDAIVDASIRQMETFADLVAAVAKSSDQFTEQNVSLNQARDWLVEQYPDDLVLVRDGAGPSVAPRPGAEDDARAPAWLAEFDLADEELSAELIEEQLVPKARARVAQNRLQTLATMVLLGMNRVVVRDGTISARLRFRAAAADHARVDYAVGDDPAGAADWGRRGSTAYAMPTTKVATVGVNVQSDAELKAELFGEVKINFATETLPLERFVDDARRTLLERHARPTLPAAAVRAPVSEPAPGSAPASAPQTPQAAAPVAPAPPAATPAAPAPGG